MISTFMNNSQTVNMYSQSTCPTIIISYFNRLKMRNCLLFVAVASRKNHQPNNTNEYSHFILNNYSFCSAIILLLTFECSGSKGLRASYLSSYTEVYAGQNARIPRKLLLPATLCYRLVFLICGHFSS